MSNHKLCMIPGPVEFDSKVLEAMANTATSHVAPSFIASFSNCIKMMREVWLADSDSQPFIVAGSGTLCWDMTASNLLEKGDNVLVVNTGIFGDWFAECLEVYGGNVDQIRAAFGDRPSLDAIAAQLKSKKYKMITVTHVDTSSSVLTDIKGICNTVRAVSPETLIVVDGVCSLAAEELRMKEWGVDVALTASQKAIGVPPGLALMVVSKKALDVAIQRTSPPTTYFASFKKWLPIMRKYENKEPSYFATPSVQLVLALEVSLKQILDQGMDRRFQLHREASKKFKDAIKSMGMKIVPVRDEVAANALTAVYFPDGVSGGDILKGIGEGGVVVAGGLHPEHSSKYFRVGHMNISACDLSNGHLEKTISVIQKVLKVKMQLKQKL